MLPPFACLRRDHWERDGSRTVCAQAECGRELRKFNRHHCRKCGKLFCGSCLSGKLKCRLNALAEFDPRGVFRKVCRECFREHATLAQQREVRGSVVVVHRRHPRQVRKHWEPNRARKVCANSACHARLKIWNRHHCRHCGKLFCGRCVDGRLQRKLNLHAGFDPQGEFGKVCEGCFKDHNGWFGDRNEDWLSINEGHSRDHSSQFAELRAEEKKRRLNLERSVSHIPT